jgi:fructose-specific phosphotransferase system IIA component
MKLSEYFSEQDILFELDASNKYQAIESLIDLLDDNDYLTDKEEARSTVIEREQYLSTGLENGIACPHGKTTAVNQLRIAFALSKTGVDFDTLDGKPAHFIFLIVSSKDKSGPHIKALSKITRYLKTHETREKLMKAESKTEIINIIKSLEE